MTAAEIKRSYEQAKNPEKQIRLLAELNDCTESEIRELLGIEEKPKAEAKQPKTVNVNSSVMELLSGRLELIESQIQKLEEEYKKITVAMEVIGGLGL